MYFRDKHVKKEGLDTHISFHSFNFPNDVSNGASKSYGSTDVKTSNGVETVNGEKYEEIIDSEDEANAKAAAEAIQAIRGSPG